MVAVETSIAATSGWWMAYLAPVPIIGFMFKAHLAQNARIRESHEVAAKAEANTAKLKEELASCRLGVEKDFASNHYIADVEQRLTKRIETMEMRLLSVIKG